MPRETLPILPRNRDEGKHAMDSSKLFGGRASLGEYMGKSDDGTAAAPADTEEDAPARDRVAQQAETLKRMALYEQQRRRRLQEGRAMQRQREAAGAADARARRRRDRLAALSPLAKAAGVDAGDGVHARLAMCDQCSTRSVHRARAATSARARDLAASAGRAALRRRRDPREALDAQRADAPATRGGVVDPVPHAKINATQRRLLNRHRLRQDPPVASSDLYPDAYHADTHRSAPVFGDAGDRTCVVDAQFAAQKVIFGPVPVVSEHAKREYASCVSLV